MDKGEENSAHRVHTAGAPVTPLNPGGSDPDSIGGNRSEPGFRGPFPLNIGEIYNSFSMQNVEMWHSIPCRDLLALADAGGEMNMMFGNQVGPFGSSFHGPVPVPDTRQYGVSDPPMYLYDLNAPPMMFPDPELSIGLSCPFTPVTPEAGRAEHSHVVSNTAISNEDVGTREVDKMDTERAANLDQPPQAAVTTLADANRDSEKGLAVETNLNETPQLPKPPRRRKHRPRVVVEGGRKSAKKPTPPKPEGGSSTGKRKYVRKKGVPTPETGVAGSGATVDPTTVRKTRKPCKRKLDFNEEQNPQTQVQSTEQDQVRETHPKVPESQSPSSITPGKTELPHKNPKRPYTKAKCHINFLHETHDKGPDAVPRPNGACLDKEQESSRNTDSMGKARVGESAEAYLSMFTDYNSGGVSGLQLPPTYKKNRARKGISFMSPVQETNRGFLAESSTGKAPEMSTEKERRSYSRMQVLHRMENFKRQKTKALTQVHDSPSFGGTMEGKQWLVPEGASAYQASHQWHAYMGANAADFHVSIATKKRGKKDSTVPSLYQNHQHLTSQIGCDQRLRMKSIYDIDALNNQFKQLNINSQMVQDRHAFTPYMTGYDEKNALVVYQQDGTLVPFVGLFNQVKKRKPRPKVDLDDETSRVWRLLLEDINSQGVNGTDEEKARWWEEERNVFRGRADSFIARMHLVQGDRRFSQWKGSVLDSVIGVFLTQNVSDHLSSSAFMSLAARFPLKPTSSSEPLKEACQVDEAIQVDETIRWHEEKSNQPTGDHGDLMLQDGDSYNKKEAVNSNGFSKINPASVGSKDNSECEVLEVSGNNMAMYMDSDIDISAIRISETVASFLGDQVEADDIVSSQNSTDMSPNSLQFGEELKDGSKATVIGGSTSFVELLHMQGSTMLHGIYSQGEANKSINKKNEELDESESMAYPQEQNKGVSHGHNTTSEDSLKNARCSEEKCVSEQSGLSAESASQSTVQMVKITSAQEPKSFNTHYEVITENPKTGTKNCKYNNNSGVQAGLVDIANFSAETSEVAESNIVGETSRETVHKVVESNLNDHGNHPMAAGMDEGNSKAKKGKTGKAKPVEVVWDSLRVQAEVKQKRERTANSMDSLDYDAVRRADVSEVADAIKERGMNNRLAARMKEFLDRVVKDHGSTDLEWLRDVPPDKAKEYLLSFKGLGLKSVECVRLLTLHHLAFPVDTNVGRIAVRLGWVPLQPLPESLQLHLLELYPVLESIQQYLWPRLCKLDQRTLYELHYQMITFGKVFCTKSKPNCNACPMRAECRHFASAFASARLALPAPEDKSMVTTTENKTGQSHTGTINQQHLTLPPPPPDQELQQQFEVRNCDPVIEEPASPEPIVEVPATPEPEPEPEQTQQMLDIEDFCEDPEDIPMIKLNFEEFTQNLQTYMEKNMELGECDKSRALVALTSEAASIPTPKLKNVSQLRTEHQVYELPDSHPLLEGLDKREPDDPCSYLLAIWTPGETANSIQPPEGQCRSQETGTLCNEETCFFCNSVREANAQTVRGTLLIPCRTAMRGSFPLNGTYFQVNEVFADHDSSLNPIDVPRSWLWNLPRRTVYFGTSIPTIFKGLTTKDIQYCFWRGFVCVRGFDQKTRAPRPLMARLHFPISKLKRSREKTNENQKLNQSV